MLRLNIGCGQTPTAGWKNYDNSWSVQLAKKPMTTRLLEVIGVVKEKQKEFIEFIRQSDIHWANAIQRIPEADQSVDVVYSSHMVEHIDKQKVMNFLKEARRVLVPGGVLRLAVPNIQFHIENYLNNRDADEFMNRTHLSRPVPRTIFEKLNYLFVGDRHHQWMYDGDSLCKLLAEAGLPNPQIMEAGTTKIADPGPLNLSERSPESVFVEAVNP